MPKAARDTRDTPTLLYYRAAALGGRLGMARASSSTSHAGSAILGKGAHIRGRIAGDGDLRVDGAISGDVALKGDLIVSDCAEVVADVQARAVVVEGAIEGDISATSSVAIRA